MEKIYKEYNYVSRYASLPFYYDKEKYVYGIGKKVDKDQPYTTHYVSDGDTLEKLALDYYGRPDYYWAIAQFNNIIDPYEDLSHYAILLIPSKAGIK